MKIKLLIILISALFMFSCADQKADDSGIDATGDATTDTTEDTGGTTIKIEVPGTYPDATTDTDTGETGTGDDTGTTVDNGDTNSDNGDSTDDSTPPVIVVEVPRNELLTTVNIGDAKALALSPRNAPNNSSASLFGRMLSIIGVIDECQQIGVLEGDVFTAIATEGSVPCFSEVEMMEGGLVFAKYHLDDISESPALAMYSVAGDVELPIIIDASGDVHHLPGTPKRRNSFKNVKMVKIHDGKPYYINSSDRLVRFDTTSDTEIVMVNESITNFSIKEYSGGRHYVVDSTSGVKRIKPNLSEDMLPEMSPGNYHEIGNSFQYLSGGKFKRMIIDADGVITDRVGRSDPEEFLYWIVNGVQTSGTTAMPNGVLFGGSISGCTDEAVGDQRIMICNGKAFRVKGDDEDLEEINWIGYGHPNFNSWLTIRSCASQNYLYFYSESDSMGNRLTWINDLTGEFRDILSTHQITDLECISDSEIAVIGTIGELTETLSITEADTASPIVAVIDSQITDIITP